VEHIGVHVNERKKAIPPDMFHICILTLVDADHIYTHIKVCVTGRNQRDKACLVRHVEIDVPTPIRADIYWLSIRVFADGCILPWYATNLRGHPVFQQLRKKTHLGIFDKVVFANRLTLNRWEELKNTLNLGNC
jgi:hypothetical protein